MVIFFSSDAQIYRANFIDPSKNRAHLKCYMSVRRIAGVSLFEPQYGKFSSL